ncbi:MAG TPA: NADH-quinone oxidoreductase subunit L [Elusimicrobia bacterium]|nr:MAG: NADH-quinone oxidoreductase subunit L [Elusimicrobia bacterium GWD2_63_28]HCC48450.1 NADH-quinone oxidoreductase subunit L [Elusimicrobiota bacterium]
MEGNYYHLLKWILAAPLAGFLLNGLFGKKFLGERGGGIVGALAIFISFVFAALSFSDLLNLPAENRLLRDTLFNWISAGTFGVDAAFRFDPLSAVMALIVTGVSFLIHVYSIGYMKGDAGYNRYFAYLNLFVFFMLALVLADNPLVMFVGWEGVGLCSYLLIGFWYEDPEKATAGKKAFITNRVGDAGFLIGLMLLSAIMASKGVFALDFETLRANAPLLSSVTVLSIGAPTLICLLLFFGATGKSAQFPLYVWLPDAMAGPTPVSALIHAATMVTAGVYMLARLSFLYELAPKALEVVMLVGCFTAFFAAVIGLAQKDIKKVLAYSTVSQLGYMFMAAGAGAYAASVFHLATHAFFKALLFLGAGSVIHGLSGEQDLFKMGGLRKEMPITFVLVAVGWLAIAGVPGLSGFYSKDLILEKVFEHGGKFVWAVGVITAALTAFYTTRLFVLAFLRGKRGHGHAHESPLSMTLPMAALALLALAGGFLLKDRLFVFLDPAFIPAAHTPEAARLMLISVGAGLTGIIAAFLLTLPAPAAALKAALPRAHSLVFHKFYVDELYGLLILKPLRYTADKVLFALVDAGLIDGLLVNGTAKVSYSAGKALAKAQNGRLDVYALVFALGVAAMLYWII